MTAFSDTTDVPGGLFALFDRSKVALTIADLAQPDCPLVGMNDAFEKLSGYRPAEALGRNCRFMQPEGGAGPVRDRIRAFLASDTAAADRFVLPNHRRDGTPFLNLVYMAKLRSHDGQALVLGSQFRVSQGGAAAEEAYNAALTSDLRQLRSLLGEGNWMMFGSFEALANSQAIIAQSRLDQEAG